MRYTGIGNRIWVISRAEGCPCDLQEYSAALQQTLAHDYAAGSQHAKWTTALSACLAAHAQSLQADSNIDAIQVCLCKLMRYSSGLRLMTGSVRLSPELQYP